MCIRDSVDELRSGHNDFTYYFSLEQRFPFHRNIGDAQIEKGYFRIAVDRIEVEAIDYVSSPDQGNIDILDLTVISRDIGQNTVHVIFDNIWQKEPKYHENHDNDYRYGVPLFFVGFSSFALVYHFIFITKLSVCPSYP